MTPDLTKAQPGDRLTLEVEFVRHATDRMIVVASGHDGTWCSFPVPIAAIAAHEPTKDVA